MRAGLGLPQLRRIYTRVARHYDLQHALVTAGSDQRGRRMLVERAVKPGDRVLDCGAGTGTTGILAAVRAGPAGRVTLFDLSEPMLDVARTKAARAGVAERMDFHTGDMLTLPFASGSFDVVLSTYSLCPVDDPPRAALEQYRVVTPGGRLGLAHSTEPEIRWVRWLAERVERGVWLLPALSLGCRPVSAIPALVRAGGRITFQRRIGVPLWPFLVAIVDKPADGSPPE